MDNTKKPNHNPKKLLKKTQEKRNILQDRYLFYLFFINMRKKFRES
jgi:hypothetical protein